MPSEAPGKDRPVRSAATGSVRTGREVSASQTRRADPALRPCVLNEFAIGGEEHDQPPGGADGAVGRLVDAAQEELEPGLPVAVVPHGVEQPVVLGPVLLEVEAQVEQRLAEHAGVAEEQRDQQPPDAAVAVEEGVDGLELHVRERRLDEHRQVVAVVVQEALQGGHAVGDGRVRRRHEDGVAGARAADPVLAAAELARVLVAAAAAREQLGVDLAHEARAQREAAAQAREAVLQRAT